MPKLVNPFICGGSVPPEYFVGRSEEVDSCFDKIVGYVPGSVAISGERRVGKTSLLHYIKETGVKEKWGQPHRENIFLFLDCHSISRLNPTRFWQRALKLLLRQVAGGPLKDAAKRLLDQDEISCTDFEIVLDALHGQGRSLVLLLDEFEWVVKKDVDSLATTRDFLSGLRALINRMPNVLSLVVATRTPLNVLSEGVITEGEGSPFYNNFIFVRLKPFRSEEVDELIEKALEGTGIEFTEVECSYIRQIAGTQPFLVQIAGSLIFEVRASGLDAVENYEPIGIRFEEQVRHHFADLWNWSNEREQTLLMLLALRKLGGRLSDRSYDIGDLGKVLGRHERDLRFLAERGLVVRTDNDPTIFSSVFEWWVVQEMIANSSEEEVSKREWLYGGVVTREELDQIKRVMKAVMEKTDIVKRLADWAVEAVMKGAVKGVVS